MDKGNTAPILNPYFSIPLYNLKLSSNFTLLVYLNTMSRLSHLPESLISDIYACIVSEWR
jgi:hypothetical protein